MSDLYHEIRGDGPALLFIPGASGDAGGFAAVADLISDSYTVITYDRRGNSRSPALTTPTTTVDEMADDAAELVKVLGAVPCNVYGNSAGAIIALNLALRYPELVRKAILHEPPLLAGAENPDAAHAMIAPIFEYGAATGGSPDAMERFLREVAGVPVEDLDPAYRARVLGNGHALFVAERGTVLYRPSDEALAGLPVEVSVLCGSKSAPFYQQASRWLADRVGTRVVESPGAHVPQLTHPAELATLIPRLLPG